MRYEELASEPERVIGALCERLGLDYQPAMLRYYAHEQHPIAGNMGTHFLVNRAQQIENPLVHLSHNNVYYADHPLAIRLDLRWRQELEPAEADLFEQMAGAWNEEMRWDDEAD